MMLSNFNDDDSWGVLARSRKIAEEGGKNMRNKQK
jgi:hypothetical protein